MGQDVALLVDNPKGLIGLYEWTGTMEPASLIVGRYADILTRRGLHRVLRDRIESSASQVLLMTESSPVARLIDITDAIDLVGPREMTAGT